MNNNSLPYQLKKTNDTNEALATQLAENAQDLQQRSINVKNPPAPLTAAKCDGTSNDTSAINALISYVSSNGGGKITFPAGKIKANISIANCNNVTIEGSFGGTYPSFGGTVLIPNDVTKPIISVGDGINQTNFIRLNNLFLNGTNTTDGLYITGAQYVYTEGLVIYQCRDNIHITSSATQACSAIYLNNFTSEYAYQNCLYADWGGQWTTAIYATNYRIITDQTKGIAVKLVGTVTLNTTNGYIDTVQNQGIVMSGGANVQGNNTIVDLAGKTKGPGISITDKASTNSISNYIIGNIILNNATVGYTDKQINTMYQGVLPSYMYLSYPNTIAANNFYADGDFDGSVHGYGSVYKDSATNNMMIANTSGGVTALPQDIDTSMFLIRKFSSTKPQAQFMTNGGQAKIGLDLSNSSNKVFSFTSDWGINFQFPNDYGGNHLMIGTNHVWVDTNGRMRIKGSSPSTATDGTTLGSQVNSGTTANRPLNPYIQDYFDTTINKPIWPRTLGNIEVDTLTINTGATTAGNVTISLNGTNTTVAVTTGDSANTVATKIAGTTFTGWTASASGNVVTFTKTTVGTNTAPSFTDTGTTGVTVSFVVTTAGTNTVWAGAFNSSPENVGMNTTVNASVTSLTVTLPVAETTTSYGVFVTPYWNTTYWITNKQTGQFTINFGTAPASANTLDWFIRR